MSKSNNTSTSGNACFLSILTVASSLQKIFRKIGWGGDDWSPEDYARQIKNLPDSTLKTWYDSAKKNKGIPNTPLAFQQKLTKIEMQKRGLLESLTKVNAQTRKILEEVLKSTKSISTVASSIGVQSLQEISLLKKLLQKIKGLFRKLFPMFKKNKNSLKKLELLSKEILKQ